jgi:hypothetical protein
MRDDSRENVREIVEQICFSAYTQPWPSKTRDRVRGKEVGFDGARAARVLAGVLDRGWRLNSLTVVTGLEPFGYDVGLVSHYAVRDALYDLDKLGWVEFKLGTQDDWSPGGKRGEPSWIKLVPHPAEKRIAPDILPSPNADEFRYDQLGSAGWFILTRILIDTFDETDFSPSLGVAEIVKLTGMTQSTVKRTLLKMTELRRARREGSRYTFVRLKKHLDDTGLSFSKCHTHQERSLRKMTERREAKTPTLWRLGYDGQPERWNPLGYFRSGNPYWTEDQLLRGDSERVSKTLNMAHHLARTPHRCPPTPPPDDEIQYLRVPLEQKGETSEADQVAAALAVKALLDRIYPDAPRGHATR